jgi:hypothetical protein
MHMHEGRGHTNLRITMLASSACATAAHAPTGADATQDCYCTVHCFVICEDEGGRRRRAGGPPGPTTRFCGLLGML